MNANNQSLQNIAEERLAKLERSLPRLRFVRKAVFGIIIASALAGFLNLQEYFNGRSTLAHAVTPPLVLVSLALMCRVTCSRIIGTIELLHSNNKG